MIELVNVVKEYKTSSGVLRAVDNVSFTIGKGERVGILGHNGSGKSTIVRLVGGVEMPTAGKIIRRMSVSWPLGFRGGIHPNLTAYDNIRFIARIYDRPYEELAASVEEFSELGKRLKDPVFTYSSGMRAKLSFGVSLGVEFDCYLIDEIVAFGDRHFRQKCRVELFEKRSDRALLIVSHLPNVIHEYCDNAIILRNGRFIERLPVDKNKAWRAEMRQRVESHSHSA
jgi:capsular polysaccharide transport system ATP-binding protein